MRRRCASSSLFCDSSTIDAVLQFVPNGPQRAIQFVRRGDELFRRKKRDHVERFARVAGQRIETGERIDFVAEKFDSHRFFVRRRRINFNDVSADAEPATREIHIVALVKHLDQAAENRFASECADRVSP